MGIIMTVISNEDLIIPIRVPSVEEWHGQTPPMMLTDTNSAATT